MVVDRFKVRHDSADSLRQRLAESFETALRLADGRALVLDMDSGTESIFSGKFACPICGYSLRELEPRLFSFNNPAGACPTCDGLGQVSRSSTPEARGRKLPELSLAGGAIRGWDRRNVYYFQMLDSLAEHYDFDVELPFEELPDQARQVLLQGSGEDEISFTYQDEGANGRRRTVKRSHPFEGILPNLERRYRETDSAAVREELAQVTRAPTALPALPRHPPAPRGAQRAAATGRSRRRRARQAHLRGRARHAARGAALLRGPEAQGRQGRDRRQGDPRDRRRACTS